jgi:hypothetical protein
MSGREIHTRTSQTFVGFEPPTVSTVGISLLDFSIVNKIVRAGSHCFWLVNNSNDSSPPVSVLLEPKGGDSPSQLFEHRPEREVARVSSPVAPGEYFYCDGNLNWSTFGHRLEDLTCESFTVEMNSNDPDGSNELRRRLIARRVNLPVLGIYSEGPSVIVRIQNQSDEVVSAASISLSIHLAKLGPMSQHLFVGRHVEDKHLDYMEPMQIGEARFSFPDSIDDFSNQYLICQSFGFRPAREEDLPLVTDTGVTLVRSPTGSFYSTTPTVIDATDSLDTQPPVDRRAMWRERKTSIEATGKWVLKSLPGGKYGLLCLSCGDILQTTETFVFREVEFSCLRCLLESQGLSSVIFNRVRDEPQTTTVQADDEIKRLLVHIPTMGEDVVCRHCHQVYELSIRALLSETWRCPGCEDSGSREQALSRVRAEQERRRRVARAQLRESIRPVRSQKNGKKKRRWF